MERLRTGPTTKQVERGSLFGDRRSSLALWHLPLFHLVGTSQYELKIPFLGFAFGIVGISILFTWLHNNTNGSIWTAIFFHWIFTYSAQVVSSGVVRSPQYNWLEYAPYYIAAIVIVLIWKPKTLARKNQVLEGGLL
jgi:CAAX protease family protein